MNASHTNDFRLMDNRGADVFMCNFLEDDRMLANLYLPFV